jgi:hypothetical protein
LTKRALCSGCGNRPGALAKSLRALWRTIWMVNPSGVPARVVEYELGAPLREEQP